MDKLFIQPWSPWEGTILLRRGESFDPVLVWEGLDWSGYTARCEITGRDDDITLSTQNGGLSLESTGEMSFWLSHTDTESIEWNTGLFSLFVTTPEGYVRLHGRGSVIVDPGSSGNLIGDNGILLEGWRPWAGTLILRRGETFNPLIKWKEGDPLEYKDWTGYSASCVISYQDGNEVELSTANGGLSLDSSGGMQFFYSHLDTQTIASNYGSFVLYLTDPDAKTRVFGRGSIQVE
jgi:hypothetical protein